ncbi:phospholipase [Nonomuraea antimicrobica]|uniref:Phospholipase n=1 Tax=Nonomuraea antimicrobica TaxID=561173 RepID=A0ABP7B3K5_9ACTN
MVGRTLAALPLVAVLTCPAAASAEAAQASTVTLEQKLAALDALTQPTEPSAAAWHDAWDSRASWGAYGFDWSSDLCSGSPDRPLGFDFRPACRRHDFGYRNYKALGRFPANKEHVDSAFLFDMRQVCVEYAGARKTACDRLAWSYYQAVRRLGGLVGRDSEDARGSL